MRGRVWLVAGCLHIAFQLAFLAALHAIAGDMPLPIEGPGRTLALLAVVGVPGIVWPAFFRARDRRAPEPARHVVAAFLGGMAAAGVFALPIERDLFATGTWMYRSLGTLVLAATLIRGTLASLLLAWLIRHGLAPLREFDEPVDGLVYGAFAGTGFATITSLTLLIEPAGLTVFAAGVTAALNALTYASVGALVGHLAGRWRWAPGTSALPALLVGVLLTGVYHAAVEAALRQTQALWAAGVVAVLVSAATLAGAAILAERLAARPPVTAPAARPGRDGWTWAVAALLLAAGAAGGYQATRDVTFADVEHGVTLQYPPTRLRPDVLLGDDGRGPALGRPVFLASGDEGGPFSIAVSVHPERVDLASLDPVAYLVASEPIELVIRPVTVGGRPGLRAQYARLRPGDRAAGAFPETRWVHSDIVPADGGTWVFTLDGSPAGFARQAVLYEALLRSVRWTGP